MGVITRRFFLCLAHPCHIGYDWGMIKKTKSQQLYDAAWVHAEKRGWSMARWAREAGTSCPSLSRIKNGHQRMTLERLERLIRPFGLDIRVFAPKRKTQKIKK